MVSDVPSEDAELAAATAMEVLAQYRLALVLAPSESRPRLTQSWSVAGGHSSSYGAIVSIATVVEQFVVAASRKRLRRTLGESPRLAAEALAEFDKRIESRWDERTQGWRRWYGIDYRLNADFVGVLAFVEARNAIVHGAGRLTRQQLGSDGGASVVAKLKTVGVEISNGRIVVTASAVEKAARCARAAIYWIDKQLAEAADLA